MTWELTFKLQGLKTLTGEYLSCRTGTEHASWGETSTRPTLWRKGRINRPGKMSSGEVGVQCRAEIYIWACCSCRGDCWAAFLLGLGYPPPLPTACLPKPLPHQGSSPAVQAPAQVCCSNEVISNNWLSVLSICLSFSFKLHGPKLE